MSGNFGPPKKYLDPPPRIPYRHPPCPSAPPPLLKEPPLPPPGIFNPKTELGLPLPLPRAEKIKNIRNVHRDKYVGRQKVGYGMVVDGITKFQALKFTFQGLNFPVNSQVLLVRRRIPQKFQALKFQNSGPELWRIHPPPLHTPPCACLV